MIVIALAANLFLMIGGQNTMASAACYGGPILSMLHSVATNSSLLVSLMIKLVLLYTIITTAVFKNQ